MIYMPLHFVTLLVSVKTNGQCVHNKSAFLKVFSYVRAGDSCCHVVAWVLILLCLDFTLGHIWHCTWLHMTLVEHIQIGIDSSHLGLEMECWPSCWMWIYLKEDIMCYLIGEWCKRIRLLITFCGINTILIPFDDLYFIIIQYDLL